MFFFKKKIAAFAEKISAAKSEILGGTGRSLQLLNMLTNVICVITFSLFTIVVFRKIKFYTKFSQLVFHNSKNCLKKKIAIIKILSCIGCFLYY